MFEGRAVYINLVDPMAIYFIKSCLVQNPVGYVQLLILWVSTLLTFNFIKLTSI